MSEAAATAGFSRWLSDERLTRRACGGDERAFTAIFRRYHQPLYRFCLSIVGNPEDAQDALQNTMVKVLRALPGEERTIELKPWLYRIAHNESIDLLRRRRETRELDTEQAAPGHGLAEDAVTRDRLRRLLADLRELPERQREVLVMRELSGLEFEEIGAALGTTDAVARQTLYEARQSLRQMAEGREMSCDEVTRALSDGDGRVIRRRDVRAHLRSCADCRAFRDEIKHRQYDLAALSPLPAIVAAGMLQGLAGGSGAAGGGLAAVLGGGAAKTVSAGAAAKGIATVAVAAAVGVGAADRTGVIHLGLPGEGGSGSSPSAPAKPHSHSHPAHAPHGHGTAGQGAAGHPGRADGRGAGRGVDQGRSGAGGRNDAANPQGGTPPARGPEHGPQQGKAPEHSKTPGPPAQSGHGKQPPAPATSGQEAATERKPPAPEKGDGGGDQAVTPPEPPRPTTPPAEPPAKEPPPPPQPVSAPEQSGKAPPHPGPPSGSQGEEHAATPGAPGKGP